MKKLSTLIFAVYSILFFGQKMSDYKYILIPEKFSTFKEKFDLDIVLAKSLKGKKYMVLQGSTNEWPSEAKNNSCNILNADVIDDSGFLRNKVILQFKDCHDKIVLTSKGSSNIKDYQEGFQDALKQSLVSVPQANPTVSLAPVVVETKTIEEVKTTNPVIENTSTSIGNMAHKYTNGILHLQKVQIDNTQFILVKSDSSIPYATLKETTKKGIFRVKLESGVSTIGYIENGNIVIETPTANGEYSKEIFVGK